MAVKAEIGIPRLDESTVLQKPPKSASPASGTPDVTVVTVVFNAVKSERAEEFRACLDSVQAQTGCKVEHLIVDGASSDGTCEKIREYANAHVPIRLYSAPDSGIYEAMNRGIALARGKYVVFLNSDDFFHDPNGLAVSVRELESRGADFSYAPTVVIDGKGFPVAHVFCEGHPFALSEGMTLCHQSMLTRRETLIRLNGFDTRYRSAADYDLLLRMMLAGSRACRVATPFVTFRLGGFSAAHADVCDREMAAIYGRRFNGDLGTRLSSGDGRRMRASGFVPEAIACRMARAARQTYGDGCRLSGTQREEWRNLLAGRLQESATAWSRRLRMPSVLKRLALSLKARQSSDADRHAREDDLDFMYRCVQCVQAVDSVEDQTNCIESKFGLATAGTLAVSFTLNDWLRYRPIRIGLLLRLDTTGCGGSCLARVSCRGRTFARIGAARTADIRLVDIALPASYNTEETLRLHIDLVDRKDRPLPSSFGAALVYGGLAVW